MNRFLIVDDDDTCRALLELLLSSHGRCDLAHDGREAVAAYRIALDNGHPYDLVCLDIMMPEMDGHDTLRAIREIERERRILGSDGVKVLMLTASEDSQDCIRAFTGGCESYVPKPIEQTALLVEVRRLLPDLAADEIASDPTPSPKPEEPALSANRFRCLIVDDDRVCREVLRDMLRPVAECDFAFDGLEAVDVARLAIEDETLYDLICMDIMMPGMDGHGALSAIRELESEHGIRGADGVRVVMTTALRDSQHCIQSFREGCECYVTKPVDQDVLFEKLRSLGVISEKTADVVS